MVENLWLKTYGGKLHIKTKDKAEQTLFLSHRQTFSLSFFYRLKLVAENLHLVFERFHFALILILIALQGLSSLVWGRDYKDSCQI